LIEQSDARLTDWVTAVVGKGVTVALTAPVNEHSGTGVSLFLMDLVSRPPMRGQVRTPVQLALRYLVTVWAEDPVAEHKLLGDMVAAAMQEEGFEVVLAPVAPETWLALGARPRPAFVLQVPVRQPRPEPVRPRVRGPLVVQGVPLVALSGVVLGPGDVPVANARVDIPSAGATAQTDPLGRFHFAGLPAEPAQRRVRVRARGRQMEVEIAQPEADTAVVIHFDHLLEG
jgi:hypothetical protein